MSKTPLVLIAAACGAAFLCSPASAQSAGPFASGDCREARLDQVAEGRLMSSEPVIICKRSEKTRALVQRDGLHVVATQPRPEIAPVPRRVDSVAFGLPPDRECAMLSCPTFVLTGIGD
jgi:hypothetical protein